MSVQNTPITRNIGRTYPRNVTQTPGRHQMQSSQHNNHDDQILGIRNLVTTAPMGQVLLTNEINQNNVCRIVNTTVDNQRNPTYGKLINIEKAKEIERICDRSALELNLNLNFNLQDTPSGPVKKNLVGVKLVGMDGATTLRRPSQVKKKNFFY